MSKSRWKGQFCKQNKPVKPANFVSKFKTKHAIEEQSHCLEESQNCFESKIVEGLRFIGLDFLIEQLRRGCCRCSHANCVFFVLSIVSYENRDLFLKQEGFLFAGIRYSSLSYFATN